MFYSFNATLYWALAGEIKKEKEIKGIWIRKEKAEIFLFFDDMIMSIRNLKKIKKNLIELLSEFNKVQIRSSISKINVFLYVKK